MKIANIWPVYNQEMYAEEEYVMILAHLLKKGLYKSNCFSASSYTIMDNGLFEGEQVSTNLEDLLELADNCGIVIDEVIVPDAVNDSAQTIKLFEDNLTTIRKRNDSYRFMVVAQAKNYKELEEIVDYYNKYADDLDLAVGISKLAPFDRNSAEAQRIYKKCRFPIHLLGIKTTFQELDAVAHLIRGCDTSQLAYIAKNEHYGDMRRSCLWTYVREENSKPPIDLEHDKLDFEEIAKYRRQLARERG